MKISENSLEKKAENSIDWTKQKRESKDIGEIWSVQNKINIMLRVICILFLEIHCEQEINEKTNEQFIVWIRKKMSEVIKRMKHIVSMH